MKKGSEKGRAFLCSSEEQAVRCTGTTTVNMQCCRILEIRDDSRREFGICEYD
jgi:hypothetical protein